MPRCADGDVANENTVVSAAPTSTTNITGFCDQRRRVELDERFAQSRARRSRGSKSGRAAPASSAAADVGRSSRICWESRGVAIGAGVVTAMGAPSLKARSGRTDFPAFMRKCSTIGVSDKRREERQRPDDQHRADQQSHEERPCVGNVPLVTGICLLRREAAGCCQQRQR